MKRAKANQGQAVEKDDLEVDHNIVDITDVDAVKPAPEQNPEEKEVDHENNVDDIPEERSPVQQSKNAQRDDTDDNNAEKDSE